MAHEIKMSTKDGTTTLGVLLNDDLYIAITCELSSSHIKDKYTFRRYVLLPSKLKPKKWDNLAGEKFCMTVPLDTAIAYMNKWINEMIEIFENKDTE